MKYTDIHNNPKKYLALSVINFNLFDKTFLGFKEKHNHYLRYHDIMGKKPNSDFFGFCKTIEARYCLCVKG